MAYLGTTQASSLSNPPVMLAGIMGAGPDSHIAGSSIYAFNNAGQSSTNTYREGMSVGGRLWQYFTTDVTTTVLNAGYFSDAGAMGMRPFDWVLINACGTTNSTASVGRLTYVTSISTAGAASLSSGLTSTS
jgi:hypothetical protein